MITDEGYIEYRGFTVCLSHVGADIWDGPKWVTKVYGSDPVVILQKIKKKIDDLRSRE